MEILDDGTLGNQDQGNNKKNNAIKWKPPHINTHTRKPTIGKRANVSAIAKEQHQVWPNFIDSVNWTHADPYKLAIVQKLLAHHGLHICPQTLPKVVFTVFDDKSLDSVRLGMETACLKERFGIGLLRRAVRAIFMLTRYSILWPSKLSTGLWFCLPLPCLCGRLA